MPWHVDIEKDISYQTLRVVALYSEGQETMIAAPLELYKLEPSSGLSGNLPKPFMNLPYPDAQAFLQALVDAAWDAGVRPAKGMNEGHEATLRDALNDTRETRDKILSLLYHLAGTHADPK